MKNSIYKILTRAEYERAKAEGEFHGSTADLADGFIHFSAPDQLRETCAKHFSGLAGLVLLEVDVAALPASRLRWEPSRGGALFPHLYDRLDMRAVKGVHDLALSGDGTHDFSRAAIDPDRVQPG